MTTSRAPASGVVEAVARVCERTETADELFEKLSRELSKSVRFDSSMWFGVDPATLLAVAPARVEGMDSGYCSILWHNEFHTQDVALFRDLARDDVPASSIRLATDERPLRSLRFREFVKPQGYEDELRVVFRTGDSTWGVAGLYREAGRPAFDGDEVAVLAAVSSTVANALRSHLASSSIIPSLASGPGLLLFDEYDVLTSANAEAERWLDEIFGRDRRAAERPESWVEALADPHTDDLTMTVPLFPLLARARAIAAGVESGQARLRLRDQTGRWVVLHASCLDHRAGEGSMAVVVEPAKSAEIAPIVIEAYGLTARERDVVRLLAQGLSTPAIATQLFLSAHTVRDHIKSVFEKVGVTSRGELVARFFAEHYADPMHEALVHAD